jgi:hypothetical protein
VFKRVSWSDGLGVGLGGESARNRLLNSTRIHHASSRSVGAVAIAMVELSVAAALMTRASVPDDASPRALAAGPRAVSVTAIAGRAKVEKLQAFSAVDVP